MPPSLLVSSPHSVSTLNPSKSGSTYVLWISKSSFWQIGAAVINDRYTTEVTSGHLRWIEDFP